NIAVLLPDANGVLTVAGKDGVTQNVFLPAGIQSAFAGIVQFDLSGVTPGGAAEVTVHLARGNTRNQETFGTDPNGNRFESFVAPDGTTQYAFVDGQTRQGNAYLRYNYLNNRFEEYVDAAGNPLYSYVDRDGDGVFDEIRLTVVDGDLAWDGDGQANGIIKDPGIEVSGDRLISGGRKRDVLTGNVLANTLNGKEGNDRLFGDLGRDILRGGRGKDQLTGGEGADVLIGGKDKDVFVYGSVVDSLVDSQDRINRFEKKDRIRFRGFDADSTLEGTQRFDFIGSKAFSGVAGQLRATRTSLEADLNGDSLADFAVSFNRKLGYAISESQLIL
ncbi:MAG: calcium-binding protein, partial [Vulcanococcus sp.]